MPEVKYSDRTSMGSQMLALFHFFVGAGTKYELVVNL